MKRRKKHADPTAEEDGELTPVQIRELKRRIRDMDDPVRYVVYSELIPGGRWRLFLDVSDNVFTDDLDGATLFKREHVARAVAAAYSEARRRDLLVAKITTKNGRRRVLRYDRAHPDTPRPKPRGKRRR